MRNGCTWLLLGVVAVVGLVAPAAAATAEDEVVGLIAALGRSGCEFERNGRWHDANAAKAHLQRKYDWLRARDLAPTTALFIERAASKSSRSGKPYRVRCEGAPIVPAEQWFKQQLDVLRGG